MLKANVSLGKVYVVKVSGKLCRVRLDSESQYSGWNGTNLSTGREVRIKSAAKLRREFVKQNLALEIASCLNNQTHEE